jgi:hypothetical protein
MAMVQVSIRYITELGLWTSVHRSPAMAARQLAVVALVTVGTVSILVSVAQTSEQAIVKVQQGLLQGKLLTSVRSKNKFIGFLGIPYAKPPVGELKFKVTSETVILASCIFTNLDMRLAAVVNLKLKKMTVTAFRRLN